jgi:AcrR family transcriptional regulator
MRGPVAPAPLRPPPAGIDTVDVSQRRSRARRGEGDRLRDEILEAAEALLIATNDQSALSIRAIAAAVGVTPPSIYLHFADRNDLLFEVCERHWVQLEHAMNAAVAAVTAPIDRIRARGLAYLHFGLGHPEHYRILMMSRPDDTPDRFADERLAGTAGIEVIAGEIQEAIDAGDLPAQDPLEAACLLWIAIHGMVSLLIAKPDFPFPPVDQLFEHLAGLSLAGLGAGREAAPTAAGSRPDPASAPPPSR